jgi:hypothetical protein
MGALIRDEDLNNTKFKFGFLFWDVPAKYTHMGNLIRVRTRPFAKAVNNSVRIFPWENAALVEGTVLEIRQETGQVGTAYVLPLTGDSEPYLIPMVEDAMKAELARLCVSLKKRIEAIPERIRKAVEEGKTAPEDIQKAEIAKRKAILRDVEKRMQDMKAVAVAMRLMNNFEGWAKMAKELILVEKKALEDLQNSTPPSP